MEPSVTAGALPPASLVPAIDAWTLKRAAWAYGCAKAGSVEEAQLLDVLKQVFVREAGR